MNFTRAFVAVFRMQKKLVEFSNYKSRNDSKTQQEHGAKLLLLVLLPYMAKALNSNIELCYFAFSDELSWWVRPLYRFSLKKLTNACNMCKCLDGKLNSKCKRHLGLFICQSYNNFDRSEQRSIILCIKFVWLVL